jgi:hemerythrin-like metal-binding protein
MDDLTDGIKDGKGKYVLGSILDELLEYTSKHFLAEELEMMSHSYPEYEAHKKEHDALKSKVRDFYSKFYAGDVELEGSIMQFLNDWLRTHIARVDKQYGPFFNERGLE